MNLPDTTVVYADYARQIGLTRLEARTPGNLIKILKAILVDGHLETPIQSCVYDADTGEAVLVFADLHYYEKDQVLQLSGITPEGYNGRWKITAADTHEVRVKIAGMPAGPGAGEAMLAKLAPAGWTMPLANAEETVAIFANKAGKMFRVQNDQATSNSSGGYTHANTTTTYYQGARVRAVRDVVDLDTFEEYAGAYFTPIHRTSGNNAYSTSAEVPYDYVADDHGIYLAIRHYNAAHRVYYSLFYLGMNADPERSDRVLWCFGSNANSATTAPSPIQMNNLLGISGSYAAEKRLESDDAITNASAGFYAGLSTIAGRGLLEFPNTKGEFLYDPEVLIIANRKQFGTLPGMAVPLHHMPLDHGTKFVGAEGKTWLAVHACGPSGDSSFNATNHIAMALFDITGPWR